MKLDMVGIIVRDLPQSITFYQQLGFTVAERLDNYAELINDGVRISLNTTQMITQVYGFEPTLTGEKIELAFRCDTRAEVDALCLTLQQAVVKQPWDAFWGQYYAIIKDPNGNLLSLFHE